MPTLTPLSPTFSTAPPGTAHILCCCIPCSTSSRTGAGTASQMMLWSCAHASTPHWSVLHRGFTVFHLHRLAISSGTTPLPPATPTCVLSTSRTTSCTVPSAVTPPPPPDPLQFSHHTVDRVLSRLHLPVRLKGGGLRSSLCTTRAAFGGSVTASSPRLVDNKDDTEGEVVPGFFDSQLSDCIGRGTFNENDSSATRYTHFMESSRSHYVPALREAWQHMGQQAALSNLPDEGNHLILPAESARGDQKQLTSLLESGDVGVCLPGAGD